MLTNSVCIVPFGVSTRLPPCEKNPARERRRRAQRAVVEPRPTHRLPSCPCVCLFLVSLCACKRPSRSMNLDCSSSSGVGGGDAPPLLRAAAASWQRLASRSGGAAVTPESPGSRRFRGCVGRQWRSRRAGVQASDREQQRKKRYPTSHAPDCSHACISQPRKSQPARQNVLGRIRPSGHACVGGKQQERAPSGSLVFSTGSRGGEALSWACTDVLSAQKESSVRAP